MCGVSDTVDDGRTDRIRPHTIFTALTVLLGVACFVVTPRSHAAARASRRIQIRSICLVHDSWQDRALFHNDSGHSHRRSLLDARAQDLEPRAYSNSPTGLSFAIVGYGYAKGSVLTDPSLPLDNVSNESHVAVFAYATTLNVLGKSAKFDVIVPYVWLTAKGVAFCLPHQRYVTGFADPAFRFSMNFIGAPALTAAEFGTTGKISSLARVCASSPLGQ
jgi:hypothetical protein